jgi:hypothetical protein
VFYAIWPFPSFCSDDLESKPKEAKAAKAAKAANWQKKN